MPTEPTAAQAIARRVWSALATGQGGMDWSGLPIVAAWLGVADMDDLLHHLSVINAWRPPQPGQAADDQETD